MAFLSTRTRRLSHPSGIVSPSAPSNSEAQNGISTSLDNMEHTPSSSLGVDIDLHRLRQEYTLGTLDESEMVRDPSAELQGWVGLAIEKQCLEPNAMVLSTVGTDGQPSSRVVLMKKLSRAGLVFYSSYTSRKGKNLQDNPKACVLFHWASLERQVRVEGTVHLLSRRQSVSYFHTRPSESQLSAAASPQSRSIASRAWLEKRVANLRSQQESGDLPCPENWGGYLLRPIYYEFWQGRANRLHDRIYYKRQGSVWKMGRLAP